ncbi:MAG: hypothetical protein HOD28_01270 [Candidatus Marinimicrobia bacterium]|mgnify:FL=1|nr:hypothetical protein [Candidatus Neomarinimicrobiota bacterium]MBT4635841.1 hypothetical protein [Candidatus Neomarinimicrobiota bacterium]MBT4684538.1 hypothetical protein [Candidatus Neomarinimicrobiota bacterium]MBT4733470.1 hypothetical protein [Candidatus Neomarinimicrobiota bacterium]MBT6936853.1 hypothetical protein [Candidatus Neomarinimicrobiota bacterium]
MNTTNSIYLKIILMLSLALGQSISYKEGAQFYDSGNLEFCFLAQSEIISGQIFEEGTGVHFKENGDMDWVFLQKDTMIQGHLCRGNGHGFMTSFYPNGKLKTGWLTNDEIIQGIPCSKFRFVSAIFVSFHDKTGQTSFHENGILQYCELSEDMIIEGKSYKKTDVVRFDFEGNLLSEY